MKVISLCFLTLDNVFTVQLGCSDFATYEDALRWFEYYKQWYGDVAKLDRDGDGIPCPGLPHTKVQEMYRIKIPNNDNKIAG